LNYFEQYKVFGKEIEYHYFNLLQKFNYTDKTPKDIKERLKVLQVRKGKEHSMKVIRTLHKDDPVTKTLDETINTLTNHLTKQSPT